MRGTALGLFVGAAAVWTALGAPGGNAAWAQRDPSGLHASERELIALSATASDNGQQFVVIDPQTRAMGVYHVDASSGTIKLKSVRNLTWDLNLLQFNGTSPLPEEVRTMVEPR
ncbi:MAG: hypothetical protein KF708_21765 [Pirellulales bacterium]|nr:hypothetical protein [Pirellulales bacterium]